MLRPLGLNASNNPIFLLSSVQTHFNLSAFPPIEVALQKQRSPKDVLAQTDSIWLDLPTISERTK